MPILDQAGFKSTQFIITGFLGNPGYVTSDQVLAMRAAGHEIGAHTRSHPDLSTLDDDHQRNEILGSFDDLVALGIHPSFLAYPYGDYNATTVSLTGSAFLGARTTMGGTNDKTTDPLLLHCYLIQVGGIYQISDIGKRIDAAQANGTWLIFLFHRVDEPGGAYSVPHDVVQQVVDYLTAHKTRVVTMSEGFQLTIGQSAP